MKNKTYKAIPNGKGGFRFVVVAEKDEEVIEPGDTIKITTEHQFKSQEVKVYFLPEHFK